MVELLDLNSMQGVQPFFIYRRVALTGPVSYMFYALDYGFFYLLRTIHARYAETDGVVQYPNLNIFAVQKGSGKEPQNQPIPINLFCTPGNAGIVDSGGVYTVGSVKAAKLQNVVYPFRDNMEFQITGQAGGLPLSVDIMLLGYYVPVKNFEMWGNNGEN